MNVVRTGDGVHRYYRFIVITWLATCFVGALHGQTETAARPIVGLRKHAPKKFALTHADVVVEPGQSLLDSTVLIEGTTIIAMGDQVDVPPGFMTIDLTGKRVYAGLIDAWSEVSLSNSKSPHGHWNGNVTPERNASVAIKDLKDAKKRRSQGFTTRVVAPKDGILKGSSCVVLLSESEEGRKLLKQSAWQHLSLTVPRNSSRPKYPNSPMGAVALARQTLHDASWYRQAWDAYTASPEIQRPETNTSLNALAKAIDGQVFVIDAPNERMAIRADSLAREFSLPLIIRGSGREYRALDQIANMNRPVLVPVDFPETPEVTTVESASDVTLQDLMHWDLAPENPGRLSNSGVSICLTTDGLDDVGSFLKQVRVAVDRGLHPDAALAALTTTPARLLELDDHLGQVRPGMLANLVVTDGDLLAEETKVLECWVAGEQFLVSEDDADEVLAGTWDLRLRSGRANVSMHLELEDKDKLVGRVTLVASEDEDPASVDLKKLVRERDRLSATVDLHSLSDQLPAGLARLSIVVVSSEQELPELVATITLPDSRTLPITIERLESETSEDGEDGSVETDAEAPEEKGAEDELVVEPTPTLFPLGAYGREEPNREAGLYLFRGATLWTCDEAGKMQSGEILIRDGLIVEVGEKLTVPNGCQVIDVRGKHITPGLIDCHSHMGTDGGINESGQAVTAEVRIGDFIDNSDIQIYRQLAGGLTTSNILHGSANPIGGQNQVIKLRWGATMDGLRLKEAPGGIKFALGENVKRNQLRYPNTRMGVEQIIRDQLIAAREYQAKWRRWRQGTRDSLPPRVDLQLEALAEVQRGERWIHCHSYRQDEIVATLDVLEEFGIQIGTLQHILEGYKVADRMAQHGAMGSSFSDWWAYKFEVLDAIPYNGALMHGRGVVVSFNSDDRELARHLNTEAAKATKYGGVAEQEALKFVTLNPAKQLRIDEYVGSLTPGKHADLVVWSGRPLSTLSRCEQTWIDGRRFFDLQSDQEMRVRDAELRARLIQKALSAGGGGSGKSKREVKEEDRWVRRDIYCQTHGGAKYEHEAKQ
ncbi:MAG: amidohydrolase family protein [Rubripirellula sp.]